MDRPMFGHPLLLLLTFFLLFSKFFRGLKSLHQLSHENVVIRILIGRTDGPDGAVPVSSEFDLSSQ